MSKHMRGENPGWHVVTATGQPVSGPWLSPIDARLHGKRKPAAVAVIHWTGFAVSAEFSVHPDPERAAA